MEIYSNMNDVDMYVYFLNVKKNMEENLFGFIKKLVVKFVFFSNMFLLLMFVSNFRRIDIYGFVYLIKII